MSNKFNKNGYFNKINKLQIQSIGIIYCRVLQNLYISGTEDVPAATICRTCFVPSELKLWHFLKFSFFN
ncbi:hypothetical protein BpHYR1_014303 [Brachionus plicatilis]|uniref:Uncharacterized protein n=1 Tax=Brachionus plicatilis TaxID=10195 RepID=A0A3M7PKG0_BRAPC|nr:hypothetical protein BpHYR1_014303 [Brachionus plicatilis]